MRERPPIFFAAGIGKVNVSYGQAQLPCWPGHAAEKQPRHVSVDAKAPPRERWAFGNVPPAALDKRIMLIDDPFPSNAFLLAAGLRTGRLSESCNNFASVLRKRPNPGSKNGGGHDLREP